MFFRCFCCCCIMLLLTAAWWLLKRQVFSIKLCTCCDKYASQTLVIRLILVGFFSRCRFPFYSCSSRYPRLTCLHGYACPFLSFHVILSSRLLAIQLILNTRPQLLTLLLTLFFPCYFNTFRSLLSSTSPHPSTSPPFPWRSQKNMCQSF